VEYQGFLPFVARTTVERVALPWSCLPRYLVLNPASTVRFDLRLARTACEVDIELQNPRPGRAFLLLVGPHRGPIVRRMRLSGRARILFEAKDDRSPVLMLANPEKEPLVLRLRGRARHARRHPAARPPSAAVSPRPAAPRPRHRLPPRSPTLGSPAAAPEPPAPVAPLRWAPRRLRPKG
jgi:hypothetical protein